MRLGGYCPGCGGGAGNQTCAIARCSLQHDHIEYCFRCPEFPCSHYVGVEEYDSFITHQHQLSDLERANEIGVEAYNNELSKKTDILRILLSDFDDGRKKTFYCVAINLLPLWQVEKVMQQITDNACLDVLTIKEKTAFAVGLFQVYASQEGLILKLRKKPAT